MNELIVAKSGTPVNAGYNAEQIDLIKRTICKGSTDDEMALFLQVCKRTGLDPFARQIYAVKRWDAKAGREAMTMQTSIDGFRLIAERSGKYAGQVGPFYCGADGKWSDVWLEAGNPKAAKVGVIRSDFKEPIFAVAKFDSYKQTTKDGKPTMMWSKMGEVMIAKCAESQALRRAFPQELSGLYTSDEMAQSESMPETIKISPTPHSEDPDAASVVKEFYDLYEKMADDLGGDCYKKYFSNKAGECPTIEQVLDSKSVQKISWLRPRIAEMREDWQRMKKTSEHKADDVPFVKNSDTQNVKKADIDDLPGFDEYELEGGQDA
jgi:phage recombination protein Bet